MAKKRKTAGHNPHASPSVLGIDAGRKRAERLHRRRKRKDKVVSTMLGLIALGALAGAGYVAYSIYDDQRESEEEERQRRLAEHEQPKLTDTIRELDDRPKWNGPGAPAFGVGDGSTEP